MDGFHFMKEVSILVVSCDQYSDLWEPFFRCFFKYWPDCPYPIFLGTNYKKYSDSRVVSLAIGQDISYSDNLLSMLSRIDSPWVILWVDDRFLACRVITEEISVVINKAARHQAGYLKLISASPLVNDHLDGEGFGEISEDAKYRVCITVGLWRKVVLERLLVPGETAWEIERNGSCRSALFPERFFVYGKKFRRETPIRDQHILMKGNILRDAIPFLLRERLSTQLPGRKVQGLRDYLYYRTYIALVRRLNSVGIFRY
jgi:hypothetical protein